MFAGAVFSGVVAVVIGKALVFYDVGLMAGGGRRLERVEGAHGRDLHSFTSQLNLSAFYGIRGARRDCVARVKGLLGGVYGV
jgi:hypothetical protein